MKNIVRAATLLVAVLAVFIMGFFSVIKAQDPGSYANPCTKYDQAIRALESEHTMTLNQSAKASLKTRIADLRQQAADEGCGPEPQPSEPTATATPDGEPSPTPTDATPSEGPTTTAEGEFPTFFFYEEGKIGARDFGPPITGTEEEMIAEYQRRLRLDPALLCVTAERALERIPGGYVYKCTVDLAGDEEAHKALLAQVNDAITSIHVAITPPGVVDSTYMVDVDGYPSGMVVKNVHRPEAYDTFRLRLKDGRTLRARPLCGGQLEEDVAIEEEKAESAPAAQPAPTPTPTKPAPGPSTTPETTPTPDTTPSETPSDEPSEEPSDEPSEEPSEDPSEDPSEEPTEEPEPKDPSKDPQEQGNIPDQVGDGDDTLPTAEGCINGGVRNRDGVCNEPSDPAVEQPDPTETYVAPETPSAEPVETERSVEPQPTNAPSSSEPEQGREGQDADDVRQEAEESSDPTDNPFGETNP